LAEHCLGISPSIRQVLDKALAKDPEERFQTGDALAKALRACKDPTWSGKVSEGLDRGAHVSEGDECTVQIQAPAALASASAAASSAAAKPKGGKGLYLIAGLGLLAVVGAGLGLAHRAQGARMALAGPIPPEAPSLAPRQAPAPTSAREPMAPAQAALAPVPSPSKGNATPPKAEAPRPEPPLAQAPQAKPESPKADPPEVIGRKAAALIGSDPRQAVSLLKPLVQSNPGNVEWNANLLAALYRSRSTGEFDRALTRAAASGITTKAMFTVPSFRAAMIDERNLRKADQGRGAGVLPQEVMDKVLAGL
jgi:serine/threonine-protein kinase